MTKSFDWNKHYRDKERKRMNDYKNGIIHNSWKDASKHARIIRNAKPPKPL